MASDSSWCIRKRFFANIRELLEPAKKEVSNPTPSTKSRLASLTKSIFDNYFYKPILLAFEDPNPNVAAEALIIIHEYPLLFSPEIFKDLYLPLAEKLIVAATGSSEPALKLQLSKEQGQILDFLDKQNLLDPKILKTFFLFFRSCIVDEDVLSSGEHSHYRDEEMDYGDYTREPQEL